MIPQVKFIDENVIDLGLFAEDAIRALGGPGSGNFDHAGRPGEVGGSAESGGSGSAVAESSSADHAALQKYIGTNDAREINSGLRQHGASQYGASEKYKDVIDALDRATQTFEFTKDTWLYRGVNAKAMEALAQKGEFIDNGFVSITKDKRVAEFHAANAAVRGGDDDDLAVVEVLVPAGTTAFHVDRDYKKTFIDTIDGRIPEREFILPRGISFTVLRTRNGYRIVPDTGG